METLTHFLDRIPIRHDLASHIILLGLVQGFFLAAVIFVRATRESAIRLYGWALLVQCLVCLDIYMCYTGLIKYAIFLNDSTEPLVLLIAPGLYFFLYALLLRKPVRIRTHWPHFVFPLLYAISQIGYYGSPMEVRLNAYLAAYHSDLGFVEVPGDFDRSFYFWKDHFRWMVVLSFVFYFILSVRLLIRNMDRAKARGPRVDKFAFSRNTMIFFLGLILVVLVIFLSFEDDGGDHLIGMVQTLTLFITSFFILAESRFFERSWLADKYETLPSDSISFEAIERLTSDEACLTQQQLSLRKLSELLDTHAHSVSKLINTNTGMNFNDYINRKRTELAKGRLLDPSYANWTVEAVGQSVGFRSKSAFYSAFKKHVGHSPTAHVKRHRTQKGA